MNPAEHKAALELVEEIQEERAGARLPADQVPYTLQPYQARWLEDRAKVRIVEKSRRFACKSLGGGNGRG